MNIESNSENQVNFTLMDSVSCEAHYRDKQNSRIFNLLGILGKD